MSDSDFKFESREVTRIGGRLVPHQVNLRLLEGWIRTCDKIHGFACSNSDLRVRITPLRGLRVIDVKSKCLVDAPPQCRYIALSYVWGETNTLRCTRQKLLAMQTHGFFKHQKPPATIDNDMSVVEGCGETYLWVDALCIVQDDPSDLNLQMAQMGNVFATAIFTIVASSSDHADSGLPGAMLTARSFTQERVELNGFGLLTLTKDHVPYPCIANSL